MRVNMHTVKSVLPSIKMKLELDSRAAGQKFDTISKGMNKERMGRKH